MVRIGMIGCGKIAQIRHIPECKENKDCEIHGLYDANFNRASELANNLGVKAYTSLDQMFEDPDIDAVVVMTPNSTHCDITKRAFLAGKHVLCEKPMATTLDECHAMVNAATQANKMLMIGQNQRLTSAHIKARELISAGALGDIITFKTNFAHAGADTWSVDGQGSWFMNKSLSCFGVLADLGVHKLDTIQYMLGQTVTHVSATVQTLHKMGLDGNLIDVDDNTICILKTSGGAIGTLYASWTNQGDEDNSTIIYGSLGTMHIYADPKSPLYISRVGKAHDVYDCDSIQTNENQTKAGIIDAFVHAIIDGLPSPISGESVIPAMAAVFAAVESNKLDGKFVATVIH